MVDEQKIKFKFAKHPDSFKTCLQQMVRLFHILDVRAPDVRAGQRGLHYLGDGRGRRFRTPSGLWVLTDLLGKYECHQGGVGHGP
jgi:hypothetical protein